ncbi:MAG: hypothetical protein WCL49_06630 [bacterium]
MDSIPEWDDPSKPAVVKAKPGPSSSAGCLIMAALSVAILVAAVVLGIQTRSGCELVAGFLQRQTGLDLTVGGASITGPTEVCLTDVQTKPTTTPLGSFKAREIRIALGWGGTLEMTVAGAHLEVVKTADGWVPAAFGKIATLNDVRETASLFIDEPRLVKLDIRDSGIIWSGPDGERLCVVEGLGMGMRPLKLAGRSLSVFEVTARTVRRSGGSKGSFLQRLWVSTKESPYGEVEYRGSWEGDETGVRDWWSTPPGTVKRGAGNGK